MLKNVAVIFVPCNKPRRYVKIWAGIALPPSKTMPHLYLACQINHYVVKVRKYCNNKEFREMLRKSPIFQSSIFFQEGRTTVPD